MSKNSPARVTIKSIARDLGISHMTVSRALSGSEHVNVDTRRAIIDHAQSIGYVKSSAASAMRGDPTTIVGLLLPNIINEFYARFANHLSCLCTEAGFDLVIYLTNDDWRQEAKLMIRLQALQARVVVRVPAPRGTEHPVDRQHAMKMIDLIRTREGQGSVGALLIDDGSSIQAAIEHLVKHQYHRIAYIGAAEVLSTGRQRLHAYTDALKNCGLPVADELVFTGAPSYDMGKQSLQHLLDSEVIVDAVVCGGFEISNGALDTCLAQRLDMPKQLAFVGYGDPASYRWISGGITTIALSEYQLACSAIRMIGDCASNRASASQTVATELIFRHTA